MVHVAVSVTMSKFATVYTRVGCGLVFQKRGKGDVLAIAVALVNRVR